MLTGQTNLVQAGQDILKLGPKFVVLKKGEHGCLLFQGQDVAALPALPGGSLDGGRCELREFWPNLSVRSATCLVSATT